MRSLTRTLTSVLLLAFCTSVQGTRATTVLPMNLDALVDEAQLIFTGTAVHREVVLSQDGKFPFTFVTFRVDETFKGEVQHHEVTLRFHGGTIGDEVVVVVGTPEFERGERYLLFIADNGITRFPVVGWQQGQYRFDLEPRSGARILVDDQGHALGEIEHGHWQRYALPAKDGTGAPTAVLLGQEDVEISEPLFDQAEDRSPNVPDARTALKALRRHIGSRSERTTFVPGRLVKSARPEDVPVSVEWKSVPPAR